ncbi:MAG TPA: hypothetical protein DCO86_00390 [Spirochaetaceae bacterium]|nr:hypothetical protein [Spirochaetaceae bacterium]
MEEDDFKTILDNETKNRISIMNSESYEYPKAASAIDWILIVASVCAAALLALLAATGVIR